MEECITDICTNAFLETRHLPAFGQHVFFKNTKESARIDVKCFQTEAYSLALRTIKLTHHSLCYTTIIFVNISSS